jgi:hypothetical protein
VVPADADSATALRPATRTSVGNARNDNMSRVISRSAPSRPSGSSRSSGSNSSSNSSSVLRWSGGSSGGDSEGAAKRLNGRLKLSEPLVEPASTAARQRSSGRRASESVNNSSSVSGSSSKSGASRRSSGGEDQREQPRRGAGRHRRVLVVGLEGSGASLFVHMLCQLPNSICLARLLPGE